MTIRILIVDDQPLMRQGMRMYLSLDHEFYIVGEASNGQEAILMANSLKPDVILMDLSMPHMDGIQAIKRLRQSKTSSAIIALSGSYDLNLIHAAIEAGADTYVSSYVLPDALIAVIKQVFAGHVVLPDTPIKPLLRHLAERDYTILSEEEWLVMKLLADKASDQQIAEYLRLDHQTIKKHIHRLQNSLSVNSRLLLVLHAMKSDRATRLND